MLQKKMITITVLLVLIASLAQAQKPVDIVLPKTDFDIKQASDMLNDGNCEIRGTASYEDRTPIGIKVGESVYARTGAVVQLFPLTEYMKEYLELKKKNKPNKRIAGISSLANCYRIESKVYGEKGEFIFIGLKPGKYYLESVVAFPTGVGGQEVSSIVEISKEGESVNCKLKHIF